MTPKQAECLTFIQAYIAERGFSPTYREIAVGLGTTLRSVHDRVHSLEGHGKVRLGGGKWRGIQLVGSSYALKLAAFVVVAKHTQGRLQPAHIEELRKALGDAA